MRYSICFRARNLIEGTRLQKPKTGFYRAEEVFPSFFQLRIPLSLFALGHLNSYLIRSEDRRLLIDTGMQSDTAFDELRRQLAEIRVKPRGLTDILVTHLHVDHAGLVPRLKKLSGAQLLVSAKEARAARLASTTHESRMKNFMKFYSEAGVPRKLVDRMLKTTPVRQYQAIYQELGRPSRSLEEGDEISVGEYLLKTILTPGHSSGHICLYEPNLKLLVAGDHLLSTITPHVTLWGREGNPLADYLGSLEKVKKLDVDIILPGHQEPFTNHHQRIVELEENLRSRTIKVLIELEREELTAYQIASKVYLNVNYPSWNKTPLFQKFLAVGETLAHIKFLEEEGRIKKAKKAEKMFYRAL